MMSGIRCQRGGGPEVTRALGDYNLMVPSVIAMRQWGDFEGWEHQLVLDEAKRRYALGARLRHPLLLQPHHWKRKKRNICRRDTENCFKLEERRESFPLLNISVSFQSVYTLEGAWKIVNESNDPDATLILDAFHNWNSASSFDTLRNIPASKISHYHIDDAGLNKEAGSQTDPDRVMPGDGQINLKAEIEILKEIGYDKTVSLELFNQEWWEKEPEETLRVGLERIKSLFENSD